MNELMKMVRELVESGRKYARSGLLYEAAYRYGQAVAAINTVYLLHSSDVLKLSDDVQRSLAQMREKLVIMADGLQRSAGNGKHKLSGPAASARESLHRVIDMLQKDLRTQWF